MPRPGTEIPDLKLHHLEALLRLRRWQTASDPLNGPAEHPGTLGDLFDAALLDRDARHVAVLTPKGESAVQEALAVFAAFAR